MKPGPKAFAFKICPCCKVEKPRSDYYKKGAGVSYLCKPCSLESSRLRAPKYFGKYADYQNEWRKSRYQSDADFREKLAAQKKARYDAHNEQINEKRRERWANDPFNPARKYYRRKDVKDRTPKWVDLDAILAVYAGCPKGMEVDHIIPLRGIIDGRPVSGLHVPWNLQYLTPSANRRKKNRIAEQTLQLPEVAKR